MLPAAFKMAVLNVFSKCYHHCSPRKCDFFTDWICTSVLIMQVIKKLMQKVSTEPCDCHETSVIQCTSIMSSISFLMCMELYSFIFAGGRTPVFHLQHALIPQLVSQMVMSWVKLNVTWTQYVDWRGHLNPVKIAATHVESKNIHIRILQ